MVKVKKPWRKRFKATQDQVGLGLVESVVAVAITGVTVVSFVTALSTGSIALQDLSQQAVTQRLAVNQLEDVKARDYITTAAYNRSDPESSYPAVATPPGYSISIAADTVPDADANIQRITVTILRDGEAISTIQDYKVNR